MIANEAFSRSISLAAILVALSVVGGCVDPLPDEEASDRWLDLPVQVNFRYEERGGDQVTIQPPREVTDGFGQVHDVFPVSLRSLGLGAPSNNHTAHYDSGSGCFVQLGADDSWVYTYLPEHDFWSAHRPMPRFVVFGMAGARLDATGDYRLQTCNLDWNVEVARTDTHVWFVYNTTVRDSEPVRFEFVHELGSLIPERFRILEWGLRVGNPMDWYGDGWVTITGFSAQSGSKAHLFPGLSTQPMERPTPEPQAWKRLTSPSGVGVWGIPGPQQALEPFTLSKALEALIADPRSHAFLSTRPEAFVVTASRTIGQDGTLEWMIRIAMDCVIDGRELAGRIEKPQPPIDVVRVASAAEQPCTHDTVQWSEMPEALVPVDTLVHSPWSLADAVAQVSTDARIVFQTTYSCWPDSAWRSQWGLQDPLVTHDYWLSATTGQLLAKRPPGVMYIRGESDGGAFLQLTECLVGSPAI